MVICGPSLVSGHPGPSWLQGERDLCCKSPWSRGWTPRRDTVAAYRHSVGVGAACASGTGHRSTVPLKCVVPWASEGGRIWGNFFHVCSNPVAGWGLWLSHPAGSFWRGQMCMPHAVTGPRRGAQAGDTRNGCGKPCGRRRPHSPSAALKEPFPRWPCALICIPSCQTGGPLCTHSTGMWPGGSGPRRTAQRLNSTGGY